MSNRLAENSNRNQSHFDYFEEYVEPTTETVNGENQDDRRKKQKEMHLWDVFKQFPSRPKSGSMVDNRNYEVLLQFLKVCVYLVIFLTLLVCSVVSKGTILFATSNVNSHYIPFCDVDSGLHLSEDVELAANVPENDRIAWIWCIIIAFVVPEFLGMLNAIRVCFFKTIKIEELPFIQNFLFSVIVEISHSVGMALLFLVCLPDLNTIQAASVMSCVCFIPSLLAFIESISKYLRRTGSKGFTSTLSDALAFTLQSIGVISSFFFKHKGRSESTYILPLALILASFRWWSNYVSTDEEPMNWLAKIKKDLEPSRLYMQGVTAIVRIFSFLAAAVLITYSKGIILAKFFNGFGIQQYIIPVISFSTESNSSRQEMILNTDSSVQIHVLVIQIVTSFFAYESGKFACKTLMHRFGFAFPLMLSVPITISILIIFYALRDQNACAFHGVIPDYLFFNIPTVKPFEIIFSEWYVWSAILWWLSQILITFHSWTSTCEKLARAERIFAVSTYDSLVIDQSLPLNRRKKSRSKNKHLPIKQNINIEGNDQLTIIKACVTMWHETENEMSKLVSSILRLDKDNCAMRVVQDHYNVRIPDYYDLETHIFFDDAFQCVHKCVTNCVNENETQVNNYVIEFVKVVEQSLRKMRMRARPPEKYPTPFGGRLKWTLPGGTNLIVHLKDKNKIRHKKRWSQVMYMYYLLGYNLMELPIEVERKETIAENTYILTLDGDIDFHPNAVKTLIDLMKRDESLGAACGRIHPIGSGPVVWFQKFEYAIGHWLQKSTEHMIGCVLCCPGCFSLFRGKALMDYNVIRKYATESTEARHYIQYDQGEDRWLCTLILQMGYRVEYSAASDAYTHVPENFDEFYIQRRRWIPSTMANIFDLLSTSKETRRCNNDISWIYILYQWILMGSTILGPGTIFLMLVGAFVAAFRIDNWTSLCCNLIPILTFIIVCLVCKESIQLKVAEIISAVYGLIMGIVLVGIMLQIVEDGWLAPSTLLFFVIAGQMIIGGLLHPREWTCLVCGIIYYITVPSMYMLLIIFAIFNLHNVSWGTRDSKGPAPTKPGTEETKDGSALNPDENKDNNKDQRNSNTKGSIEFSLAGLFKCMICTHKKESEEEIKLNSIAKMLSRIESRIDAIERKVVGVPSSVIDSVHSFENEKESTVYKSEKHSADYKSEKDTVDTVFSKKGCSSYKSDFNSYLKSEDSDYSEPESINESRIYSGSERNETDFVVNPSWMFDVELGKGGVSYLVTEEETFWIDVIATYLKPIVLDEETREKNAKVAKDLESLRDKYLFQFCMVNALFVIMVFLMQLNKDKLHLVWPFGATYNVTYEYNSQEDKAEIHIEKDYLRLEPIGCIFIITFVSILFIQFLAMLVHRFDTFSHLLAKTSLDWYCCKKDDTSANALSIEEYIRQLTTSSTTQILCTKEIMSKSDSPKLVTALFSFKGRNNDELCFKKGDIITITQIDDGGWWEGTLHEKTGWFPSNYVKEYRIPEPGQVSVKLSPEKSPPDLPVHQKLNRDIVLKDIIDSERANVAELQGLVTNFLQPLEASNILKKEEYKQLIGNIHEVLETHQRLLSNLDSALVQGADARVGNLFLTIAPRLKSIHSTYCNCHPQAVCMLDRYRDELNEFMERSGAISPGILVLTTGLSKPFRRLDKYSAMLQELERHTEKNHPDRGDTQRSVCVYREINEQCASARKQKELALQILTSGIKGWEGEELNSLGDILHVGPVTLVMGAERRDRYFVLFPTTLLVLSTSSRMSSFVYEGKLPLTGINVVPIESIEENKNAFEISGPMIENITVFCTNKEDRQQWIDLLSQEQGLGLLRSPTLMPHTTNQASIKQYQQIVEIGLSPGIKTPWSLASLRPAPPIYTIKSFGKSDSTESCRSTKLCNKRQFEDDAIILKVIEGYCFTVNARFTVHSAMLDYNPLHKARDRVSLVNSRVGDGDSFEDRSLSETIKTLKNQMVDLQWQITQLTRQLEDERRSRLSLAATVNRSIAVIDGPVP